MILFFSRAAPILTPDPSLFTQLKTKRKSISRFRANFPSASRCVSQRQSDSCRRRALPMSAGAENQPIEDSFMTPRESASSKHPISPSLLPARWFPGVARSFAPLFCLTEKYNFCVLSFFFPAEAPSSGYLWGSCKSWRRVGPAWLASACWR